MDVWRAAELELDGLPGQQGLNIAHEAVDRHLPRRGDREAFRFIDARHRVTPLTYAELSRQSSRFANVISSLGLKPGDAIFALTERVPELYVAAVGSLKARCLFSVLFSSFGPEPIRVRLQRGGARLLVAADTLYQRKVASLRGQLPSLRHVLTVGALAPGTESFAGMMANVGDRFTISPTSPDDLALLHFTSGTTGEPKGALHAHRAVVAHYATARLALGLAPGDVYWCTADPGWVTGISYGLIAPLTCGVTSIVDQGPFDAERWYQIIEAENVSVWYTAPTAIRMLMRAGTALARRFNLSSLRLVASVGEPLNPDAVRWGRDALGLTIRDTWWQTETGAIMIANLPGRDVEPGVMGRPLPGVEAAVVRKTEPRAIEVISEGEAEGELALRPNWPSLFRGYLGADDRYRASFANGFYLTGDRVRRERSGQFRFVGRNDEVIKTAGHLVGPFEVESVLLEHPAVAEVGVVGVPDPVTGEAVKAFVQLKPGIEPSEQLRREVLAHSRRQLGPALAPREIAFCPSLPKTLSGKIMRGLLRREGIGGGGGPRGDSGEGPPPSDAGT